MRLLCPALLMVACSVPQPELPPSEPAPEPRPHRSIDELPGPHPMPVREPVAEPDVDDWTLVDLGTIEPLAQDPCNPGLAGLYSALAQRDATMAGQVRRATLGCLSAERLPDARALVDALNQHELEPVDNFVIAKVLLLQRASATFSVCDDNAFLHDILLHVTDATDPVVSARMLSDADFESIHQAFPYKRATVPGSDSDAVRLQGTVWYGPGVGAFGSMTRLELGPEGAGMLHTAEVSEQGEKVWSEAPAQWSVDEDTVSIKVGDSEATTYTIGFPLGTLSQSPGQAVADFFSYAPECDA